MHDKNQKKGGLQKGTFTERHLGSDAASGELLKAQRFMEKHPGHIGDLIFDHLISGALESARTWSEPDDTPPQSEIS